MAKMRFLIAAGLTLFAGQALSQVPYTFTAGATAKASEVNANFTYLWGQLSPLIIFPDGNVALGFNTYKPTDGTSNANTAIGVSALSASGRGASQNTAVGGGALQSNVGGSWSTALGCNSLHLSNGSGNTAVGAAALANVVTGTENVALGGQAGMNILLSRNVTIGNLGDAADLGVIRIGRSDWHVSTFLAGVYSAQTGGAAVPVVIDANGQLGTMSSSRRFKTEIRDMAADSDDLFRLHPVTFRYRKPQKDGSSPIHYGLIAEEVAEVYPNLVAYDDTRQPQTVLYQELPVMLLNELKKQRLEARKQREVVDELRREVRELKAALAERPARE